MHSVRTARNKFELHFVRSLNDFVFHQKEKTNFATVEFDSWHFGVHPITTDGTNRSRDKKNKDKTKNKIKAKQKMMIKATKQQRWIEKRMR